MADETGELLGESHLERLVAHPTLPLIAGLESSRPAARIWKLAEAGFTELAVVMAGEEPYSADRPWEQAARTPAAAWHPEQPLLAITGDDGLLQWTPAGAGGALDGTPTDGGYRWVAFSPDGGSVWASPSSRDDSWESSDILDRRSGDVTTTHWWDTGVATHPGGDLVATLRSDQGATLVLFARLDAEDSPSRMHMLDRALILDADAYETPAFSADGTLMAIRGNAYENFLEVFEFPTLQRIFGATLGEPSPGYPYPPEWTEQFRSWPRNNIAFTPAGNLLVGTPQGTIVRIDPRNETAADWADVGAPVTALAVLASGEVVVGTTEARCVPRLAGHLELHSNGSASRAQSVARAFLSTAAPVPADRDIESGLVLTDGRRTWSSEDLEQVTEVPPEAPTWLRLLTEISRARQSPS